jgi:hypothetical protein
MSEDHVRSLAAAVPARYRQARWTLLYATARDGISLQTLLRNAARKAPTVLVVRDFDRCGPRCGTDIVRFLCRFHDSRAAAT